jgi:hypothetical protein
MHNTRHRSGFEDRVYAALRDAGQTADYETVKLPYTQQRTYTPDFVLPNGVMTELIGHFTPEKRTKLMLVRLENPGADIRLVFQRAANFLTAKSKVTYARWADKHRFLWCEGTIPLDWFR